VDGLALIPVEQLLDADGDPFLGTTIAGRFVIVGRLGAGSMGTVYRARQEAMGRDVAIKILRGDRAAGALAKARFGREARAMSLLTSPHTVTVFDFGEIPDPHADELAPGSASLYLAMELLEGESLGARLKRRGRLPVEEATRIARHALLSLAEAHDKGVIHRDLKPDNLFLTRAVSAEQGEICKVLDFGIAKLQAESTGVDALETQAGTVFGTPRYMSPEQAQGKSLDARSDLYTLGVLLYQMLVGRAPFVDDDAVVVMARHIKSIPVAPIEAAPEAGISAPLSALVMRALAKDPEERPSSAHTFLAELDTAVAARAALREKGGRVPASPGSSGAMAAVVHDGFDAGPAGALRRMPRSRAALIAGLSAVIVMLIGFAAVGALRPARAPVPMARAELGHLVTAKRLALMQAEAAAASARPMAEAPPAVPAPAATVTVTAAPAPSAAPAAPGVKRPGKRYKRFE
jgi:serine/threonine-protein kinase